MSFPHIRYLIVDDNEVDRIMIEMLAANYPSLSLAGSYEHALEALEGIKSLKPQLVFLDVEMPGATGIELLRTVRDIVPMAVLITSYPDFAIEGFELSALDYILKPPTEARFAHTVQKITEYWELKQKSAAYDVIVSEETITIKQGHDQVRLPVGDIVYLEAMQDYTKLVLDGKQYMTLVNLSRFLEQLPLKRFLRVHRSYAVAIDKIQKVSGHEVAIYNDILLPVSKTYRKALRALIL
ncbi:LytR/AlgR family response regulator transcription factor [Taibaiella koreensis]|uniref:LytR/AlgR family response regulator transcription factor n=1 Tax=Taibaiella koreensis TaxID=1268548 RepID=UPI0013C2D90D|nr:LytTR family DNA-binding domain-containing protein [Taibaiella koreensis]